MTEEQKQKAELRALLETSGLRRNSSANESTTYDYDSDYNADYIYDDGLPVVEATECRCSEKTLEKGCSQEAQWRTRELIKEGTIGGKFCNPTSEKTVEVQLCTCTEGKGCTTLLHFLTHTKM